MLAALFAPWLSSNTFACSPPDLPAVAAAFDLAANGLLPPSAPQYPTGSHVHSVPPSLLKAVGWVESGWRQMTPSGHPLLSSDFGYGIMQITSGMAGAFGDANGSLDPDVQSLIASDYQYNIAFGARALAQKWDAVPKIGDADPTVIEDWYYALWAYNGWGWVNNPNNARFQRTGTPATNPAAYPYQERVLYLVSHPPRDRYGNPLWKAVRVTLPDKSLIARDPQPYRPAKTHRQPPPSFASIYNVAPLHDDLPGAVQAEPVTITNTGTSPWLAAGDGAISVTYHVFSEHGDPWAPFSPFTPGVVALGQGGTPLPRNVLPGESVSVRVPVHAPASPGNFRVAWDLQVAGNWLSQSGVLPHAIPFAVRRLPADAQPTATPSPTPQVHAKDAHFLADTSIRDGSTLTSGAAFVKGWLVFNSGKKGWSRNWRIKEVVGKSFGNRSTFPLSPVAACRTANLQLPLHAPKHAGLYSSTWRLQDAHHKSFGDALTMSVRVRRSGVAPTPLPSLTPTRTPVPSARGTPTPTPVG